ncbi:MAG: sulfatase [Promethearchaeota archaeon]
MNVILIIFDSLRKDHVGAYGCDWIKTDNLDKFAAESLKFTNALPESLPTLPVRRAIHSGRRTFGERAYRRYKGDTVAAFGWGPIPEEHITIAEYLSAKGFVNAFISDTYHQFKPSMNFTRGYHQWEFIRGQEADPFKSGPPIDDDEVFDEVLPENPEGIASVYLLERYFRNVRGREKEEDYFPARVFKAAMTWLEENQAAQKFFLCIDSFDPHEPWDPPQHYRSLYVDGNYTGKKVITPRYGRSDYLTPGELSYMRACYAGEVTMCDVWFGRFMEKVAELGLLDNTMIILISDHGHQLGDKHGLVGKIPWGLYPELVDIPFMIRHPEGLRAGECHDGFVYNYEIFATICGFIGIPRPGGVSGRNLMPLFDGDAIDDLDHLSCGFNEYVLVRTRERAYITDFHRKKELLYDLQSDPDQVKDISSNEPEKCDEMYEMAVNDAGGELVDHSAALGRKSAQWYDFL